MPQDNHSVVTGEVRYVMYADTPLSYYPDEEMP